MCTCLFISRSMLRDSDWLSLPPNVSDVIWYLGGKGWKERKRVKSATRAYRICERCASLSTYTHTHKLAAQAVSLPFDLQEVHSLSRQPGNTCPWCLRPWPCSMDAHVLCAIPGISLLAQPETIRCLNITMQGPSNSLYEGKDEQSLCCFNRTNPGSQMLS